MAQCGEYLRRDPQSGALYQILFEHLETFLARSSEDPARASLPPYVQRELRGYLNCGVLAHGFCRFHCFACDSDLLVPFSCKGRGFCPSCGGRRMAEASAHLVDHVFPKVPVRQWVISFPWRLRYLLALDPSLCRDVRKIFLRAVFSFYARKPSTIGIEGGRTGAVNQIQRFGSALNSNLHFHALVLDGVYTAPDSFTPPRFRRTGHITNADVAKLLFTLRSRVLRLCRRRGLMEEDTQIDVSAPGQEQALLPLLVAASLQGRVALGPDAGAPVSRLGQPPTHDRRKAPKFKDLCAQLDGFSLHAAVQVEAGEGSRLEHLCRYITRPPLSSLRLSLNEQGRLVHELRAPFKDGTTHFVFDPLVFIERLAALVPPPRMHQLTYHGVLAPAASRRSEIVPGSQPPTAPESAGPSASPPTPPRPCNRYSWPELMARVFDVKVLRCGKCRSRLKWIAAITEADVIARILAHLKLECAVRVPRPARPPPQAELAY